MKFRTAFPITLFAIHSALVGQDADALMWKGEDALASGLWEMAALHFSERLAHPDLAAPQKSQVALRLAESWIRGGKPAEALDLLRQSFVADHPEARFWSAQALVGLGRFNEAVESLALLLQDPAAPYRSEAGFTMAGLQLSLGQPQPALETLSALTGTADPALTAKARLLQMEIRLDLGQAAEARAALPAEATLSPRDQPLATFLEAQLLLAEGRAEEAASSFQTLVDQPQGQTLRHYHAAAAGLADALTARGDPAEAAAFLLAFIQDHPDSPLLESFFKRLLAGLPETPSPTDPILERLADWITPAELPATGPLATFDAGVAAAWPSAATSTSTNDTTAATSDLLAFSLFTRAIGLQRIGTPETTAEARRLLTRLRIEHPQHFLTSRALFETARRALNEGRIDHAFSILDTLRENAGSPVIRSQAAFLEAKTTAARGDHAQAIRYFEEAANTLAGEQARTARLNAAILQLTASGKTTPILQTAPPADRTIAADLELERALADAEPATRRPALEEFIGRHPDHPRVAEARLAAAETTLASKNPDLSFARAQLETLAAAAETATPLDPARVALAKLHIEDLARDANAAITTARAILEQHPGDPAAAEAALILGRNLFQTRSYNDARLVLEKLAASDNDPARAQAAWLLAARAAALVPTSQSQQEALILFDKTIESQGPVSAIAKLEKARLMIDMNRLTEAAGFLRSWFDALPATDPLHLPAGLLLGEAVYAQGNVRDDSLTQALAVYDQLLVHAEQHPAVFNRLQYLRGRTLEQIPDPADPLLTREKQAFIAYYSVLETTTPPAEWHYFELCGFRALALLEKAGRWPAAIACAKKIASFKGPRANEAATRASQLQLKHMIWED